MRLSRVSRGRAVALGAAAAFVLACGCPALARAAEGDYTIYPTPHEVAYAEGEVDFGGTVNTIVESGIDGYTKTRLADTLALAGVEGTPADATSDDGEGLEVLVGVEGSGGVVDAFVDGLEQSGAASVGWGCGVGCPPQVEQIDVLASPRREKRRFAPLERVARRGPARSVTAP